MTNGDKIRQMSNEELAKVIVTSCVHCAYGIASDNCYHRECKEGIKAYLDMEVEE